MCIQAQVNEWLLNIEHFERCMSIYVQKQLDWNSVNILNRFSTHTLRLPPYRNTMSNNINCQYSYFNEVMVSSGFNLFILCKHFQKIEWSYFKHDESAAELNSFRFFFVIWHMQQRYWFYGFVCGSWYWYRLVTLREQISYIVYWLVFHLYHVSRSTLICYF